MSRPFILRDSRRRLILAKRNSITLAAIIIAVSPLIACDSHRATNSASKPPAPPRADVSPDIIAKPVLDADDVETALEQARAYKPPDQFSPPFNDKALEDKSVRLVFTKTTPKDGDHLSVGYDVESQVLSAWYYPITVGHSPGAAFLVTDLDIPLGGYVGQNIYGAKVPVSVHTRYEMGIFDFAPPPERSPNPYHWRIKLPPDQARALADRLSLVVTATVIAREGHTVVCETEHVAPTVTGPDESEWLTCGLRVKLDAVSLAGVPDGLAVLGPEDRTQADLRRERETA